MKKRWICIIAAALMLLTTACASSSNKADMAVTTAPAAAPAAAAPMEPVMAEEAGYDYYDTGVYTEAVATSAAAGATALSGTAGGIDEAVDAYGGHKIIKNYDINLETNDFDGHYAFLTEKAKACGGYVQNSYIDGKKPEAYNESGRYGSLTFRIPSDKVDEFITAAKGIGELTYYSENADDVTSQYFDVETRLNVLKIQLERLTSILVTTDNLADIIALETEIARVNTEIEQLTGELRRFDELIDYSTINLSLHERSLNAGPVAAKTVGERIDEGFRETLLDIGTFFTDLAVFLVVASPVLLILGAIAVVVVLIVKGARRRKREKKQNGTGYYENNAEAVNKEEKDNK